jgi:hypothetical protein
MLVTLKVAIDGRAKIKPRGPLKDGFYRLRPKGYGTHKVHNIKFDPHVRRNKRDIKI